MFEAYVKCGRCFARNSLHLTKEMYRNLAWTAHGIKIWDKPLCSLDYLEQHGVILQAMSELHDIVSLDRIRKLGDDLHDTDYSL